MEALKAAVSRRASLISSPPVVSRRAPSAARASPCAAVKRVIEPAYFQDVFGGAAERVFVTGGFLKREETLVLVESVRTLEHAFKTLDLICRHLENRAGMDINDWHHRKKYYMRLCELSLRIERGPDVIFALFGNLQRFKISTYFPREAVQRLGAMGAHPGILLRIAELSKLQLGPADKGVRAAYAELVALLQARNSPLDQEFLPRAKSDLKALRHGIQLKTDAPPPLQQQQAVPAPPPPAAAAAPAEMLQAAVSEV